MKREIERPTSSEAAAPGSSEGAPWPSAGRAWYAVFVLTVAVLFESIDRQVMSLLIEPIKADLKISDTQASLLLGVAFAMFSVILGLPIARLADRMSRRLIIGTGIVLWSAMTAVCGLANTYWQLFLARVGVGVGDATNAPATFSMLSDYFPKEKLPKATSVISMGFTLGGAVSMLVGATVLTLIADMPSIPVPLVGELKPWQLTFVIVGLPGILVGFLLATVREPQRRGLRVRTEDKDKGSAPQALPVRDVVRFLHERWTTYVPIFLGLGFKSIFAFGTHLWLPAFFMRTYGWTAPQIGFIQGIIALVVTPIGMMAGGFLAEWLTKKGVEDANMRLVLAGAIGAIPFSVLYPLMPTPEMALILHAVNSLVTVIGAGPGHAALQIITPNQMRGQVTALYFFVFNLIGFGLGPLIIALFTDFLFGSDQSLRYSMSIAAATLLPFSVVVLWLGLKPYRRSVIQAKEWS